jgi:hypothetical protein
MGAKGSAGAFIEGFMGGFNAERDRRTKKKTLEHQKAMDASLKEFREVQMAAQKTAQANAAEDRQRDKDTVEGLMKSHPEVFAEYLKESEVQPNPNNRAFSSDQGFMQTKPMMKRNLEAPTLAAATGELTRDAAAKNTAALAGSRKAQGEAAIMNAQANRDRVANEAERLRVAQEQDQKSTAAIAAVIQNQFPGVNAIISEKGLNWEDLNLDGIKAIHASLMNDVRDSSLTLAQLEDKMNGLLQIEKDNANKTNALFATNITMTKDARSTIEANNAALSDSILEAKQELQAAIDAKRVAYRELTEAPQEPNLTTQAVGNMGPSPYGDEQAAAEGFYEPAAVAPPAAQTRGVNDDPFNQ